MTVTIAVSCTACGACIATCPTAALRPAPGRPAVDDGTCTDCLACLEVCPVDAIIPLPRPAARAPTIHPIEAESYRILERLVDLTGRPAGARDVVARMVHATADESFAETACVGAEAVDAAVAALRGGVAVICDAAMVVAGIPTVSGAVCLLDEVPDAPAGDTRSAAAFRLAAARHPDGALWVVGNAPTALRQLLVLHAAGVVRPAAVVGLPVGYVGAADAKAELWSGPLGARAITNTGARGGSAVAAAAVNALHRLGRPAA